MISMHSLPCRSRVRRIKHAWIGDNRAANHKAALLRNHDSAASPMIGVAQLPLPQRGDSIQPQPPIGALVQFSLSRLRQKDVGLTFALTRAGKGARATRRRRVQRVVRPLGSS